MSLFRAKKESFRDIPETNRYHVLVKEKEIVIDEFEALNLLTVLVKCRELYESGQRVKAYLLDDKMCEELCADYT